MSDSHTPARAQTTKIGKIPGPVCLYVIFSNDFKFNYVHPFLFGRGAIIYGSIGLFAAEDNLRFLINWLEEFPMYKNSEFFLTGESYAGDDSLKLFLVFILLTMIDLIFKDVKLS